MEDTKRIEGNFESRKAKNRYNYPLRLHSSLKPRVKNAAKSQERSIASYIMLAIIEKLERDEKK